MYILDTYSLFKTLVITMKAFNLNT